jgi:hypothetical protein
VLICPHRRQRRRLRRSLTLLLLLPLRLMTPARLVSLCRILLRRRRAKDDGAWSWGLVVEGFKQRELHHPVKVGGCKKRSLLISPQFFVSPNFLTSPEPWVHYTRTSRTESPRVFVCCCCMYSQLVLLRSSLHFSSTIRCFPFHYYYVFIDTSSPIPIHPPSIHARI